MFFSGTLSTITYLYECVMAELYITEYSGFMKNVFFIIYHDKHSSFDRSLLERERFFSFDTFNLPILRLKCLKTQAKFKGIQKIQKEQYYQYSVFWIALRPVFNGTETIDFLVHNVWKLLIRNVWIYKSSK